MTPQLTAVHAAGTNQYYMEHWMQTVGDVMFRTKKLHQLHSCGCASNAFTQN